MASEHLMLMKRCGFLHASREGRNVFYSVMNLTLQHHGMHSVPLWEEVNPIIMKNSDPANHGIPVTPEAQERLSATTSFWMSNYLWNFQAVKCPIAEPATRCLEP